MSFKTIVTIVLAVLITIIFMQNTDEVVFTLLWKQIYMAKSWVMLALTISGMVIGVMIAQPRKNKKTEAISQNQNAKDIPLEVSNFSKEEEDDRSMKKPNQLSDEDRDYLQ